MFEGRVPRDLASLPHDPADPNPWLALYLDDSIPFDDTAKAALLRGNDSYSRRFLLPALRPFLFVFFVLVQMLRRVFQSWPSMPETLHRMIHWGLRNFASRDANTLILRHFNVGTEILAFIRDNALQIVPEAEIRSVPLRPKRLADLTDNLFLQHDLNVYNFIIDLNRALRAAGKTLQPPARLNFDAITDAPFAFEPLPDAKRNFIDVQTAVEVYTPFYALFLARRDFIRAANSLQLDETFAIYIARLLGTDYHMSLIKNQHPMVPLSPLQAGFRLMMHGYDAEALHGYLRRLKRGQEGGQ